MSPSPDMIIPHQFRSDGNVPSHQANETGSRLSWRVKVGRVMAAGAIVGASAMGFMAGNALSRLSSAVAESTLREASEEYEAASRNLSKVEATLGPTCVKALERYVEGEGSRTRADRVALSLEGSTCGEGSLQKRRAVTSLRAASAEASWRQEDLQLARVNYDERYDGMWSDQLTWVGGLFGASAAGLLWVIQRAIRDMARYDDAA